MYMYVHKEFINFLFDYSIISPSAIKMCGSGFYN